MATPTFIYTIEEDGDSFVRKSSLWKDGAVNQFSIADSHLDLARAKTFDGYKFIPALSGPILDADVDLLIAYEYARSIEDEDGFEDWEPYEDSTNAEYSIFHPSYIDGYEVAHAFMCALEGWEY